MGNEVQRKEISALNLTYESFNVVSHSFNTILKKSLISMTQVKNNYIFSLQFEYTSVHISLFYF